MPLVRVDLASGTSAQYRTAIGEVIHRAMVEALNVPEDDRFQIISQHEAEAFIVDRTYLGMQRTDRCIVIQVTLNEGRTIEQKRAFYALLAQALHQRLNVRLEDVFINLVEVRKEDWSFGNGAAHYA